MSTSLLLKDSREKKDILSIEKIQDKLNVDKITAEFFKARAIDTERRIDNFLGCDFNDLADPYTVPGMYDVIEEIEAHIKEDNIITVYGDFDVDGTTAATVIFKALKKVYDEDKINVLPANRYRDGYGLSYETVDIMADADSDLIITVDCGVSDLDEIDYAHLNGIDVVVIDHHESETPPDVPLVDLKVSQGNYLDKELCAAGMAWKVGQALLGESFKEVLDIVALATIADVVPLLGENRIIAKEGIKRIREGKDTNLGIEALMAQFDIHRDEIEASDFAFFIGPAINAAGRLGSAKPVLHILNTSNKDDANRLAFKLKNINEKRKTKTKNILKSIKGKVSQYQDDCNIIVERDEILRGVVGLVAGNLKEKYNKPTIVIDSETGKGSCRSIPPLNIYENLKTCYEEGLLEKCGGHEMAAGLSIDMDNFFKFRERMNELTEGIEYEQDEPDMIVDPQDITLNTVDNLNILAPFGKDHPSPVFKAEDIRPTNISRTYSGDHLTFDVGGVRCIAFSQAYNMNKLLEGSVDIIFEPGYDNYNEDNDIQFIVRDIK